MSENDNVKKAENLKDLYYIYIKNIPVEMTDEIFCTFCIMKIFKYNIDISAKIVIEAKTRKTLVATESLEKVQKHSIQLFALGIENEYEKSC